VTSEVRTPRKDELLSRIRDQLDLRSTREFDGNIVDGVMLTNNVSK